VRLAQGIDCFAECEGEVLDKTFESTEYKNLSNKSISAISGISEKEAALLKKAFGTETIKDLSENKYVSIAQTTVSMASLCQFLIII
jgi:predicted mannosyl-3-phosphoglycerate phosphatase (HAD superfamily)